LETYLRYANPVDLEVVDILLTYKEIKQSVKENLRKTLDSQIQSKNGLTLEVVKRLHISEAVYVANEGDDCLAHVYALNSKSSTKWTDVYEIILNLS
jgi:hypothetical protein